MTPKRYENHTQAVRNAPKQFEYSWTTIGLITIRNDQKRFEIGSALFQIEMRDRLWAKKKGQREIKEGEGIRVRS